MSTATIVATETDRVLASMFTENTGSHILDSGGAYGRNWERNAGREVEDFLAAPAVTLDARFDFVDLTINAFHWLRSRVEFAPDMQRKFEMYVALRDEPNDPWLVEAEEFAEAHKRKYGRGDIDGCVNTYNGESVLSQVLQYVIFTGPGDEQFLLLQVHGGCDVRGGYTEAKAFRFSSYEGAYDMYDESFELYCDHEPVPPQVETLPGMPELPSFEPHYLDNRSGEWTLNDGSFERDPWAYKGLDSPTYTDENGESHVRCPYCAERGEDRPMKASASWDY